MTTRTLALLVISCALIATGCKKTTPKPPPETPKTKPPPETPKTPQPPKTPPSAGAAAAPVAKAGAGKVLAAFYGLPIVAGGVSGAPPHGGSSMLIVKYKRGKAALVPPTIALATQAGWKVASRTKSPRGSVRMVLVKGDKRLSLRVAGFGGQTALIISKLVATRGR